MSSGNRNNQNTSLTKIIVGAGVGVAVGAIAGLAAYGFGKLVEAVDKAEQRHQHQHRNRPRAKICEVTDDDEDVDSPTNGESTVPEVESETLSLHQQLHHYYQSYVLVPQRDMQRAKLVIEEVKKMFLRFCSAQSSNLNIVALRDFGSVSEESKVVKADEFDVMVHFELDDSSWELKGVEQCPGYYLVAKEADAEDSDTFLALVDENGNLSPAIVICKFQQIISDMIKQEEEGRYVLHISSEGTSVTLNVEYDVDGDCRSLKINFVPSLVFGSTWIVAQPNPSSSDKDNLWRQSFAGEEYQRLKVDIPTGSCHIKCLQILKAVWLNHRVQMGQLTPYMMKTLLMNQLDLEDEWEEEALPERFFDLLMTLKQCLSEGRLDNHFCPGMNLFQDMKKETLDDIRQFIIKKMSPEGIVSLLKMDY